MRVRILITWEWNNLVLKWAWGGLNGVLILKLENEYDPHLLMALKLHIYIYIYDFGGDQRRKITHARWL